MFFWVKKKVVHDKKYYAELGRKDARETIKIIEEFLDERRKSKEKSNKEIKN